MIKFSGQMENIKGFINRTVIFFEARGIPRALQIILLLGLIQGTLYTFLIPAWWHNDEPTHFEYAWLITNRPELAKEGKVDDPMRRALAASLLKNHYYDFYRLQPDLTKNEPVYIGASQMDDPPLYYWLASLPLRLLKTADFDVQNRAARFVSVLMFLGTLLAAWKAVGEITGEGHILQWTTTLFIALLPGFADTMTAINNDAAAILAFSLFIWIGLVIIKRGFTLWNAIALCGILVICYFTKNTALPALPLALVVFLFGILRSRKVSFGILGLLAAGAILFSIQWGDSSLWYRVGGQSSLTRTGMEKPPFGDHAFQLQNGYVEQFITTDSLRKLRNKNVTIGAWMWADSPVTVSIPSLRYFDSENQEMIFADPLSVSIDTQPKFVSRTFFMANEAARAWIVLNPGSSGNNGETVYYDGVILIPNEVNSGEPVFSDATLQGGNWNGERFENLVRNPSAESGWFLINPKVVGALGKFSGFLGGINIFAATLQDPEATGSYYKSVAQRLFATFWANPARAKVPLLGGRVTFRFLEAITGISLLGILTFTGRRFRSLPWEQLIFLGLTLAVTWTITILRGGIELPQGIPLLPWARYAFPAIIPTALLLCMGWLELTTPLTKLYKITESRTRLFFIAFFGGIDILAILSILDYFSWKDGQVFFFFLLVLQFAIFAILTMILTPSAKTQ